PWICLVESGLFNGLRAKKEKKSIRVSSCVQTVSWFLCSLFQSVSILTFRITVTHASVFCQENASFLQRLAAGRRGPEFGRSRGQFETRGDGHDQLVLARLDRRRRRRGLDVSARGEGDGRLRAGLFGQGHEPAEVGASRFGVDLGLAPRVGDRERARLVEEGAEIVVAEADAVGRVRAGRHRLVEKAAQA